jgi:hypothetical protein
MLKLFVLFDDLFSIAFSRFAFPQSLLFCTTFVVVSFTGELLNTSLNFYIIVQIVRLRSGLPLVLSLGLSATIFRWGVILYFDFKLFFSSSFL